MQFDVWTKSLPALNVDALVLGVFEEGELSDEARTVDAAAITFTASPSNI